MINKTLSGLFLIWVLISPILFADITNSLKISNGLIKESDPDNDFIATKGIVFSDATSMTTAPSGGIPNWSKETYVLTVSDIASQAINLNYLAVTNSLDLNAYGVIQEEGLDYNLTVSGTQTRLNFSGGLAISGSTPLSSTDRIWVKYMRVN